MEYRRYLIQPGSLWMSQRERERLGVHESQVSRDERNEYHGITVERLTKVLEVLDVALQPKYAHA
jgi:hypothetical protein